MTPPTTTPAEIHKNKDAHIPVCADVKPALQGLNRILAANPIDQSGVSAAPAPPPAALSRAQPPVEPAHTLGIHPACLGTSARTELPPPLNP